jgi:hypothetical protein
MHGKRDSRGTWHLQVHSSNVHTSLYQRFNEVSQKAKTKKRFSLYFIKHSFVSRPSNSTVSEDAGIELNPGLLRLKHTLVASTLARVVDPIRNTLRRYQFHYRDRSGRVMINRPCAAHPRRIGLRVKQKLGAHLLSRP